MGWRFVELAADPEVRTQRVRALLESLRKQRVFLLEKFSAFVYLSLALHLALFGILFVTGFAPGSAAAAASPSNLRAFAQAMTEMEYGAGQPAPFKSPAGQKALEELEGKLDSLFHFEKGITEREKASFFRSLLEMVRAAVPEEGAGASPAFGPEGSLERFLEGSGRLDAAGGAAFFITKSVIAGAYEINRLGRPALEKIEQMSRESGSQGSEGRLTGGAIQVQSEFGPVEVPREYFYRESPYADILARGPRLFTVFNGFPRLTDALQAPTPGDRNKADPGRTEIRLLDMGIVYWGSRLPSMAEAAEKTVLVLSPKERARLLDEFMEMKEPGQLEAFQRRYLDIFDPDRGDLASFTREFFYSNLNSVFVTTDRPATAFDLVEGIFYKRMVYDFYALYGRRLSGTRTGIELYLNLAATYDFERRALRAVFEARDDVRRILAGNEGASDAWQAGPKAFVLDQLYRGMVEMAGRAGLSLEGLSDLYIQREEEIYQRLTDLGGEPKNRALYAWGRLRWGLGDKRGAIEKWKKVDVSYPMSSRVLREILARIDRYDITKSVRALNDVSRILMSEGAYDRHMLLERHLKFNTWEKRAD